MIDRRRFVRHPVSIEVTLSDKQGQHYRMRTRNISVGGVYLECLGGGLPQRGKVMTLAFDYPAGSGIWHRMLGRVQRTSPNGIAVNFIEFTLEDFAFLESAFNGSTPLRTSSPAAG